jgi:hypothetical protein
MIRINSDWSFFSESIIVHKKGFRITLLAGCWRTPYNVRVYGFDKLKPRDMSKIMRQGMLFGNETVFKKTEKNSAKIEPESLLIFDDYPHTSRLYEMEGVNIKPKSKQPVISYKGRRAKRQDKLIGCSHR